MLVSGIARILLDSGIEQLSVGIAKLSGSPDLTPWKCYLTYCVILMQTTGFNGQFSSFSLFD